MLVARQRNKLKAPGGVPILQSERFWEDVLRLVHARRLVPIVGHDLLVAGEEGREAPLYPALARRLQERFELPAVSPSEDAELRLVVKQLYSHGIEAHAIYRELRRSLSDMDTWQTPEALTKLAQIQAFKLYVTTTFEGLLARAVDEERFDGRRHTLLFSYAPADKQDLPQEFDRLDRPAVFHLLGRLATTPGSYAITDQDQREFLLSLQSRTEDVPYFLLDKLRTSDLLILGSRAADWLTRFFVRHTPGGQVIESSGSSNTDAPVVLLQHFSDGVRITRADDTSAFVDELHRRWSESARETASSRWSHEAASTGHIPGGAVFVSVATCDTSAAERLRDALDAAGVDVVMHFDDVEAPDVDEAHMRRQLSESAVFVPILSPGALSAKRSFFRAEWLDTIRDARAIAAARRFVLPVAVNARAASGDGLPPSLEQIEPVLVPDGNPDAAFIETIVSLQRRFRSASYA